MPLTRSFVETAIVEDYALVLGPEGANRSPAPLADATPRSYLNLALLEALWALGLDAVDRSAVDDVDLAPLDDAQARLFMLAFRISLINRLLPSLRMKLYNQSSRNSKWDLKPIIDGLVSDLALMKADYLAVSAEVAGILADPSAATNMGMGQPCSAPWAGNTRPGYGYFAGW